MKQRMMQDMPGIWDGQDFYTSRSEIAGAVACCAVRQSPYPYPEGLGEAMRQLYVALPKADVAGLLTTNYKALRAILDDAFNECPTIMAWNESRNGVSQMAIVTRDGPQQHPDDDFIDLDALARNAAQQITVAAKYEAAEVVEIGADERSG